MTGLFCRDCRDLIPLKSHTSIPSHNYWNAHHVKPLDTGCHGHLHCVKSFLWYPRSEVTQGSFCTNYLEWPCFFLHDSLIRRAQPAPRSSPTPRLYFLLSKSPPSGSLCGKCILHCAGSPRIPPAAMWAQLPAGTLLSLLPWPSHRNIGALYQSSSSASCNYRAKFTTFP